jgi:hypothetical protein
VHGIGAPDNLKKTNICEPEPAVEQFISNTKRDGNNDEFDTC